MSDREEISRDEIISIENSVISYLGNARLHFDNGDYLRALSFLDLAKNEIEYLRNHNTAQQSVQRIGFYCSKCGGLGNQHTVMCSDGKAAHANR